MNRLILLRGARQLLTLRGPSGPRRGADLRNLGIIQQGSVLIADGLIREVGPSRRVDNLAESRNADEIDVSGRVVLPGFVDSHTHLVSPPARLLDFEMRLAGATHQEIAQAGGGIQRVVKEMQDVSGRTLEMQTAKRVEQCIRQGTTMLEAKSGLGVSASAELRILRTHKALQKRFGNIVSTFLAGHFIPAEYEGKTERYVEWVCERLLPVIRRRKLAEFVDAYCEEGALEIVPARQLLQRARELGFPIKMHAGQNWNIGGVRLAVEMNAVSVDHAIYMDQQDIALLARSNTIATLLPGPVFYLGTQRYASARAMIDRGVAVALATNYNPDTSPSHNMQMMLSLACRKMGLTPAEAISAATINGAYSLNRGAQFGSIEFGKVADIVVLSVGDYREIPYHFGVNLVEMTIKHGRPIYRASQVKWQD